jgi:outer membrane protein assembly factor BamB
MASASIAQTTNFTFTLKVKNTQNRPMARVVVTAENESAGVTLKSTTDVNGKAVFTLTEPGTYSFSYLDVKNAATAEAKEGFSGTFMRSVTYDPKGVFAEKPKADRTGIAFKTIPGRQLRGKPGVAKVTVHVKKSNRSLVPNVALKLVSIKDKTKYTGESNSYGQAIFYVPISQTYEIDVENMEAFKSFKVPNYSGLEMQQVVFYEKTKVKETVKGDTIVQNSVAQQTGSSSHVLFTLNLKDFSGSPLNDEPVYLKAIDSERVYEGKTDEDGKCSLMVEKGTDYILNLKHESGLILVEAPVSRGFRRESATRRYRGSAVIEAQLAEQKAEMERLQAKLKQAEKDFASGKAQLDVTFRETPVESISAPANYLTKTAEGFNIDFKSAGPAATPTIIGDKMFTQEGLYSSNYYCLNSNNGSYNWGLELGESGISPAVYHDGVLLINTASCTLYAIDANTGRLLWSKWLAGYVYTTPSADDRNVYVAYNHGGYPVVVSFGLRSGELNWMRLVDEEIIASPVVEGSEVHVASQNGMYYVYDKESGQLKKKRTDLKAVSSPTITADKIYVTVQDAGSEHLVALNRTTLETELNYPTSLTSLKISGVRNVDATDQMNFNGSHPIVYQNKTVIITDAHNLMAFDIASEKMLWKKPVQVNSDQLPIVANGKVIITTKDGKVMSYEIDTGTSKLLKKVNGEIEGQPVAKNGFLYIAVGGIITVIKNATNHNWGQWNKDASHNTVWK